MKRLIFLVAAGLIIAMPAIAGACQIPVFRYALEKWDLTGYDILIYHDGPLPDDVRRELKKWLPASPEELQKQKQGPQAPRANVEITLIDLNGKLEGPALKLWEREGKKDKTPWMLVRSAAASVKEPSAWSGPCTAANVQNVIDSPMRRAVLANLTRGASAVFVLLTSNDAKADRDAYVLAHKELKLLESRIKLPDQNDTTGPQIKLPLPLKVSFPLLVLDRDDPAEAIFIDMLLSTEDHLADAKGPILFPIFGRGRVLLSLSRPSTGGGMFSKAQSEIAADKLLFVAKFLCGPCSCQVKDLNPGVDMIMAASWPAIFDQLYEGKEGVPLAKNDFNKMPARYGTVSLEERAVESQTSNPPTTATPPVAIESVSTPGSPDYFRASLWIGIGVAAGLVLLTGGWLATRCCGRGSAPK
jgi:hypothetical protein